MSCKKGGKSKRHFLLAKLVTDSDKSAPCAFCNRDVDDEIIYGKLYSIGDIQCHYFCVLLSCCLVQKGKDEEGLFGFLYPDIIAEIERSKKHKCSYCGRDGATLGCSVSQCRKQFHLPCGRERNAVSLFYGNFKSFCEKHAPRQRLNDEIMAKVKVRKSLRKKLSPPKSLEIAANNISNLNISDGGNENPRCVEAEPNQEVEAVCVICYENVDGYPTLNTFWPPCCARDAWFHRNCLQRMALSAGMHYLKCPLCNQKEAFYEAVLSQGYYVPDRDAAWELEQNAFAEIYERPVTCSATECACPMGRDYDAETGAWDIKLCILCGSSGVHAQCAQAAAGGDGSGGNGGNSGSDGNGGGWETYLRHVCATCAPAAPVDLDKLVVSIDTAEAPAAGAAAGSARGRPMPCRMSLRRTKQRALRHQRAAGSESMHGVPPIRVDRVDQDTESSRLELNLKPPKKPDKGLIEPSLLRNVENKLLSPLKLLERGLYERISEADVKDFELDPDELIAQMRQRLTKPKPLVEKKKIVNDILESVLEGLHRDKKKTKEPLKEWNSPKKCLEIEVEDVEASPIQCNQPTADQTEDAQELKKDYNNPLITVKEEPEPEEAIPETSDHPPKVEGGFQPMETEEKEYKEKENVEEIETEGKGNKESEKVEEFDNSKGISYGLPDFGSPRKLKPVHVQDSSMEISEHDHAVSIDLVQTEPLERSARSIATSSPMKARTLFKLSPVDGVLSNKLDIDVESFKCRYLDEVGGQYEASAGEEGRGSTKRRLQEDGVEAEAGKRRKGRRQRAGAAPTLGRDAAKGRRRQERRLRLVVKCALVRKRLVQTTIQSFFRPSR